ncbi:uncharacterized protein LOC135497114 isoform X2 [Lineus longissimus]
MSKQNLPRAVLFSVLVLATTAAAMPTAFSGSNMATQSTDTETALGKILSGKLKARKEARLVRKLLDLGDYEQPRQRRDTTAQASEEKLKVIKSNLQNTKVAIEDLYHRVKDAFDLFCDLKKSNHIPRDDAALATCEGWSKFLIQIHRSNMNIPEHETIAIHSTHTPEQHVENVFGKSLTIVSRFHIVIANVTTMESDHVCTSTTGQSTCTPDCATKDPADPKHAKHPYKFWCKLKDIPTRINMFKEIVKRTMGALNIQHSQTDTVVTLTSSDLDISEGTRITYNFASLWQMKEQMGLVKNAMGLLSNYL